MKLSIIILAAGHGKRMHSSLPKILHPLAGVSMIERIVNTAKQLIPNDVYVVYGQNLESHIHKLQYLAVKWVLQREQMGTGHAVLQAVPLISDDHHVLILYGDIPLVSEDTLKKLVKETNDKEVSLLVIQSDDPYGFGRIIRNERRHIIAIVEEKDATVQEKKIQEIYTGIVIAPAKRLKIWLPRLKNSNAQKEYYLTDIVANAVKDGFMIKGIPANSEEEVRGVNNLYQLGKLERFYQFQQAEKLMREGVMIMDPTRFDLRGKLQAGSDVIIDINVIFEGDIILGSNCKIEPNVLLRNVVLGDNVVVKANSVIEESIIGDDSIIGPFARLRPGTKIAKEVEVGNFVEIKESSVGWKSKIHHVCYLGDAKIGSNVNIGAGTITCNYDGVKKHVTTIQDDSFIGSGTELVAPVTINKNSYIGAGSTITDDTSAGKLTIARQRQVTIENWRPPRKSEKIKEK